MHAIIACRGSQIHDALYKRLAGGIEFIDIIPKNPSGRLSRWILQRFLTRP